MLLDFQLICNLLSDEKCKNEMLIKEVFDTKGSPSNTNDNC